MAPTNIKISGRLSIFFAFIIFLMRITKELITKIQTVNKNNKIPFSTTGSGLLSRKVTPEKTRFPKIVQSEIKKMYGSKIYLCQTGKITLSLGNTKRKLKNV
jgi:hypothetical protein